MPILDITPLGSSQSGAASAVAAIVDYLTRSNTRVGMEGPAAYFGDRAERPGIWRGRGVNGEQLTGEATPEQLRRLLLGGHPDTGVVLVASTGSSGRADRRRPQPRRADSFVLTVDRAAAQLGVDRSYVKRLLLATERHTLDPDQHRAPLQPLHGDRDEHGRWMIDPDEVRRFAAARTEPKVVVAYDATFKWEKSISAAWVQADPATRRTIEDALDIGVRTGIAYLENHGLEVRDHERRVTADGMWASQYRHTTNRNLEPQLHDHVVIANIATHPDGTARTIAARSLFTHATTAGHLAGQAVRHHLTEQLGYQWGPVVDGTCDLAHIDRTVLDAISTRSAEVRELAEVYGLDSQQARRVAALSTRRRKETPADYAELEASWATTLANLGFDRDAERAIHHRAEPLTLDERGAADLRRWLDGPTGVTQSRAVFDRNDVVRAAIAWDGEHGGGARLSADQVEHLTDQWLSSTDVIRLDRDQRGIERFTTVSMLQLETDLIAAYRNGVLAIRPATDEARVRTEIALWQHHTGNSLGDDQEQFVRHLATTSDRFVLGVGPAGTGKTVSIALACRAWEAAGFEPIAASVTGAATDVLADTCGIQTRTVASLATELRAGSNPLRSNSVLVVDEASTLSNRDHATLVRALVDADARMVTIGDPSQHRSIEAGGLWAQLLQERDLRVLTLDENRRQVSPSMADVRLAGQLLRTGRGSQAVELLTGSNRLTTATHAADLVASIVTDWHHDHTKHLAIGTAPSRVMAEHHSTRRLLNRAAQDRLRADGLIRGPGTLVGSERIHEGDEIITRAQNRDVQFGNGRFLRNGMVGHVLAINGSDTGDSLTVQFPGFGIVELPSDWLQLEVRAGLAGTVAPAYAITTHVAQGQTMDAGRAVITDGSTPEATYVALTRGRSDARLYVLDSPVRAERRIAAADADLPVLLDEPELLAAVAERLSKRTGIGTATSIERDALEIHRRSLLPIGQLGRSRIDVAAREVAVSRAALRALVDPPDKYRRDYGPRPSADAPERALWDRAVANRAQYDLTGDGWDTPTHWEARHIAAHPRLDHAASIDGEPDDLAAVLDALAISTPDRSLHLHQPDHDRGPSLHL